MDRISELSSKLHRLADLDRGYQVFGASEHRYRCRRWARHEVGALERKLSCALPVELADWLVQIGSGPGPCYAFNPEIFVPGPVMVGENPPSGRFHQLIDVTMADLQNLLDEAWGDVDPYDGQPRRVPAITTVAADCGPGLLSLGFAGCSYHYVMPLIGELRGKVMYLGEETIDEDDVLYGGVCWPQGLSKRSHDGSGRYRFAQTAGSAFGFLDWMEDWLDCELSAFASGKYKAAWQDASRVLPKPLFERFRRFFR